VQPEWSCSEVLCAEIFRLEICVNGELFESTKEGQRNDPEPLETLSTSTISGVQKTASHHMNHLLYGGEWFSFFNTSPLQTPIDVSKIVPPFGKNEGRVYHLPK